MQEEMKSDADEQDAADARVQDAQPGTDMGVAAAHENEGLSAQKAVSAAGEKEKIAESAGDVKPVSSAEDVNADSQKMAADGADTAAKNAQGAAARHNNPEVSLQHSAYRRHRSLRSLTRKNSSVILRVICRR